MGCGTSTMGGVTSSTKPNEAGVAQLPAKIRPLLKRRFDEMKKGSHASLLKGKQTQSKKELLMHGSSEDGEESEDNVKLSAKVAPVPEHHVEEKKEIIFEKIISKDEVEKQEDIVKKQEDQNHNDDGGDDHDHDKDIKVKKEGDNNINHDDEGIIGKKEDDDNINHDHDEGINVKNESKKSDDGINHDEDINAKKEGDDDIKNDVHNDEIMNVKNKGDDGINHGDLDEISISFKKEEDGYNSHDDEQGRMSNFDECMIGHGSPSFRVYCADHTSDFEGKDIDDTRKSVDSVIILPTEDGSIVKKRKGKRFGMGLPRKYFANVAASASGGCIGTTSARLAQAKSKN